MSLRFQTCGLVMGAALLTACSGSKEPDSPVEPGSDQVIALSEGEGALALDQKYAIQKGDVEYDESGGFKGGKRSQFEGRRQVHFGGDWLGDQSYQAGSSPDGKKKSWWGSKQKNVSAYQGAGEASQYQYNSRFSNQSASQDNRSSKYEGRAARTDSYRATASSEEAVSNIGRPSDAETDVRRRVYAKPKITGYKDYQKRSIKETRELLGRED